MPRVRIPVLIVAFFILDLMLGIAFMISEMTDHSYGKLKVFLDLGSEGNLPTWFSSIQWFCVAVLLGIFAQRNFQISRKKSWLLVLLPLVFLALSLDEVAQIHEWLGGMSDKYLPGASRQNTMFSHTGIWMFVIGVPFVGLFIVLILTIRTYFSRNFSVLVKITLGMSVMLAGSIGIETLSNFIASNSVKATIGVFLEELCEMIGGTIVLWGSYELLFNHGFAIKLERVEID